MDIGAAVKALQDGKNVQRKIWNDEQSWLRLPPNDDPVRRNVLMRTAQSDGMAWQASTSDLLADDWEIVKEKGKAEEKAKAEDNEENNSLPGTPTHKTQQATPARHR